MPLRSQRVIRFERVSVADVILPWLLISARLIRVYEGLESGAVAGRIVLDMSK